MNAVERLRATLAGNAYRFNTTGASSPFWVTRSVKPSSPMGLDRLTIALRGSINA